MVAQVGYSMVGRSRGRVTSCAVCTVHVESRSACFLVEPQNQSQRFVIGLASKLLERFLRFGIKTSGDSFLVEPQNQGGGGFPGLGLKTGSYGLVIWVSKSPQGFPDLDIRIGRYDLVIWASKSPRRFLRLGLKTKQASVCRLRHKTDGGRSTQDTRRDLASCFTWKQVRVGFSSLTLRLAEARRRVMHVTPS
jgi:hypothetical protein